MIKYLELINDYLKNNNGNTNFDLLKKYPDIKNFSLSEVELERLNNDLEIVYSRLEKGEYKTADFSGKNKFNVPERTKEFFTYMEGYAISGKTWKKLFDNVELATIDRICNLCPGWAPKVEIALYYSGYKGSVYIVDKDEESISQIIRFMDIFNAGFAINKVKLDIFNQDLPNYKLVIANHIIDDLLIDFYSKKFSFNVDNIYSSEIILVDTWNKIVQAQDIIVDEFVELLACVIKKLVDINGIFILSQYKSYMEFLLNLDDVSNLCHNIMIKLKEKLMSEGFETQEKLSDKAFSEFNGYFKSHEICFLTRKF